MSDKMKSVISDLEAIATNMTGDLTPANVANIALAKLTSDQSPAAAQADDGQGAAVDLAANLGHVSTQWVQFHQELSAALGLDFEPNEDIERYTEAIAALRSQVATLTGKLKPFDDLYSDFTDYNVENDEDHQLNIIEYIDRYSDDEAMLSLFEYAHKVYSGGGKS